MNSSRYLKKNICLLNLSFVIALCLMPTVRAASSLTKGQKLNLNEFITSPSGKYRLRFQGDGNLVLSDREKVYWSSKTEKKGATKLILQSDGNLVIYRSDNSAVWSSKTAGSGAEKLSISDTGEIKLLTGIEVFWSQNSPPIFVGDTDRLEIMDVLFSGESIISPNGKYRLRFQGDGNLVLSDREKVYWSSKTEKQGATKLILQSDGNLVIYNENNRPLWSSQTRNSLADRLVLTDSGELKLKAGDETVWSRNSDLESDPGKKLIYSTKGGLNEEDRAIKVVSHANKGDYQILSMGASSAQGTSDKPIDPVLIKNQGFSLIKARGDSDKRSEIWIREHSGSSKHNYVTIPRNNHSGKDLAWSITTIKGENIDIKKDRFKTASNYSGGHSSTSASFPKPGGSGFTFVAFFFDDSVKITDTHGGDLLYQVWGQGDGDGFATVLYLPGQKVPEKVSVKVFDGGGREWVTTSFSSGNF